LVKLVSEGTALSSCKRQQQSLTYQHR